MRLTKEELSTRVVVRRATLGSAPVGWEMHWVERVGPVFVSLSRFATMEAAYRTGQASLPEFSPQRVPRLGLDERA